MERGAWVDGLSPLAAASRLVRSRVARRAAPMFAARGLRYPGRTFGIRQLMSSPDEAARVALLASEAGVTEMICHPGTAEADREKPGSCARHAELEFLCSPTFPRLVAPAGVRLATYWEC